LIIDLLLTEKLKYPAGAVIGLLIALPEFEFAEIN